jgi:hypothetical protein
MMLLPSLVLRSEIERSRVLEIWRQHHGFIASFTGELNTKVPRVEGHEGEVEILRGQMLGCEGIETVDRITEGSRVTNVLPGERCQAG